MFESHRDTQLEPGSWSLWTTGRRTLIFACPLCRKPKILRHIVHHSGLIEGLVRCIEPGCAFNDHVTLVGWPTAGEEHP